MAQGAKSRYLKHRKAGYSRESRTYTHLNTCIDVADGAGTRSQAQARTLHSAYSQLPASRIAFTGKGVWPVELGWWTKSIRLIPW